MARFFNSASDIASAASGVTIPTTKGTIMIWVYPTTAPNDGTVHGFVSVGDATNESFEIFKGGDDKLYAGWYTLASGDRREGATATWNQNEWNTITYVWAAAGGTSTLLVNGSSIGGFVDDGASRFSTSGYNFRLGSYRGLGLFSAAARIAQVVVWNDVLGGGLITALYGSTTNVPNPGRVMPLSMTDWWPVDGVLATEPDYTPNRNTLTTIVGASFAGGPPIASGRRLFVPAPSTSGGSGWGPLLSHGRNRILVAVP